MSPYSTESPIIKVVLVNVQEGLAINSRKIGNMANHGNFAVVLDGAAILSVFVADENDSAYGQLRFTERIERQERVIDRPERGARSDDHWQSDATHQVAH